MIYPGAGILVSVVEAVLVLAHQKVLRIRGIELVNIHFIRRLVILTDKTVETLLSIRVNQGKDFASREHTFTFYSSGSEKSWTMHCFSSYFIVPEPIASLTGQNPVSLNWAGRLETLASFKKRPSKKVDMSKLYYELRQNGTHWGKTF